MKLKINGDVSPFYVQTLCLLFYPGSKFSEKDDQTADGISVAVDLCEREGRLDASVEIDDKEVYGGSYSLSLSESLSRPSMAGKIAVGKAFLEAGKKATGIVPPWGILTGVRPSKLARWNLDAGMSPDDAAAVFEREYSVAPDKASLACSVAQAERAILSKDFSGKCSLYIAVPFCPTRCAYCSFVSYTSERLLSLIPEYLEVLCREIDDKCRIIKKLGMEISTVYIGGGTPTVLDAAQLEKLLSTVSGCVDVPSLDEFTLEAGRPDTIDLEKMKCAASHGVTRVSVNTQTLNDSVLRSIGRRHTADDFFKAYETARSAGLNCINVDLIAGLPGEPSKSFISSAKRIADLRPENITVHTFCVKRSADLKQSGAFAPSSREAEESVRLSQSTLISSGYIPYYMYRQKNAASNLENVGFTLPGYEGLYNILMMEEVQSIFAVGASAVTKLVKFDCDGSPQIKRIAENKYPYEYLREKNSHPSEKDSGYERLLTSFFN